MQSVTDVSPLSSFIVPEVVSIRHTFILPQSLDPENNALLPTAECHLIILLDDIGHPTVLFATVVTLCVHCTYGFLYVPKSPSYQIYIIRV